MKAIEAIKAMSLKKKFSILILVFIILCVGIFFAVRGISTVSQNSKPSRVQKYLLQGNKNLISKNYKEAIKNYEQVIKNDSKNFEGYSQMSLAYMGLNQYDKALDSLNKSLKIQPQNPRVFKVIGDCQLKLNKDELAIAAYEKAVDLNKGKDSLAYKELISCLIESGKNEESIKYMKDLMKISSNDPEGYKIIGDIYVAIKDYDSAIALYNKSIESKNNTPGVYNNLAYCFIQQKKYDEAVENYNKALKIDPNYEAAIKGKEAAMHMKQ